MAKPAAVDLSGFVNLHGHPIVAAGPSFTKKSRPKQPKATAPAPAGSSPPGQHLGWHAVGFSPQQLAKARAEKGDCFDEDAYMNGAQPKRARPQPYAIPSAAQQCAEMLRKAGWKRVTVVEMKKE